MQFTEKLAKLVNGQAYPSIVRHLRHWHPGQWPIRFDPARLTSGVDAVKLARIRQRHDVAAPADAPEKYLDLEYWMQVNLRRVRELELDRRKHRRVLDLGCGAGYFLYICQQLGHDVLGVDMESHPLFPEMIALFDVPRVICEITAFVPLPDFGRKFDLITAHMICFNGHKSENLWREAEWDFFLDDLAKHLNPGGRIHLLLNEEYDGTAYTPELKTYFENRGAAVHGARLIFDPLRAAPSRSELRSARPSRY